MTWLRYDDGFTDWPEWESVSFEARWYYMALVEFAGAHERWDGVFPLARALRLSDVGNPAARLDELVSVGLVAVDDATSTVRIVRIDDHVPPPNARPKANMQRQRRYRRAKCERGEHDRHCPFDSCPERLPATGTTVTHPVTRAVTPGQDRKSKSEGQSVPGKPLPTDWRPSDASIERLRSRGASRKDVEQCAERFRRFNRDALLSNPDAAWEGFAKRDFVLANAINTGARINARPRGNTLAAAL